MFWYLSVFSFYIIIINYYYLFLDHSQFPHSAVPVSNTGYMISGQRPQRYYANTPHNVSDMKNNHMPNMTHGKKN